MTTEFAGNREPVATITSLTRPLVFLFAASIPLTNVSRFYLGGSGSIAELLLLGLAAVMVVAILEDGFVVSRGVALMAGFVLLSLAAWFWHGAANLGIAEPVRTDGVIRAVEYLLAFLSVFVLGREARIRRALVAGLWSGGAIAVAFALTHWRLGPSMSWFWGWGPPWACSCCCRWRCSSRGRSQRYWLPGLRCWSCCAREGGVGCYRRS